MREIINSYTVGPVADIATGYRLEGWGSIPSRGKKIIPTPQCPDWVTHPASNHIGSGALSPVVKRPECEADQSPSSAEVKNGGPIPPLPHTS
jgi:hypothetical protein